MQDVRENILLFYYGYPVHICLDLHLGVTNPYVFIRCLPLTVIAF